MSAARDRLPAPFSGRALGVATTRGRSHGHRPMPARAIIPALPLFSTHRTPAPERQTFIAHYWLKPDGGPALLSDKVACIDYTVGKGGLMTAYRFEGEAVLTPKHFVAV